jgi:hypothetical protein
MRSLYVLGKDALLPNLPRPPVTIIDNHAYVSLKDCVADLLGHGFEVDSIEANVDGDNGSVRKISESKVARRILNNVSRTHLQPENVLCLYLTEWSDGFEPSSAKSNRGSCWIKTVTIAPPPSQLHHLTYTYPIALGVNGVKHEEVEAMFAAELEEFRSGVNVIFFHKGIGTNVKVYLELFASLQDQPERRSANYVMLGGSTYTARWGLALDFAAVASGVPACSYCLTALMGGDSERCPCPNCVCWDTDVKHGLLDFPPPDDFPAEHIPPSGLLPPLKLSYQVMKAAVKTAHNAFVTGEWSRPNVLSYLRVHGLNKEAQTAIIECAVNCKMMQDAVENSAELQDFREKSDANAHFFRMWKFPSLWDRGVDLQQHIDVAMHLIFLGVVKTCIQMVQEWTTL